MMEKLSHYMLDNLDRNVNSRDLDRAWEVCQVWVVVAGASQAWTKCSSLCKHSKVWPADSNSNRASLNQSKEKFYRSLRWPTYN